MRCTPNDATGASRNHDKRACMPGTGREGRSEVRDEGRFCGRE
jgi:hypothetical protein